MKILMVCLGNICRSPIAEGILQYKARQAGFNWTVESAGTNGFHNGAPPHRLSQKVALLNGINISQQRSRRFIAADFNRYDIIYAMAQDVIDDIKQIAAKEFIEIKVKLLMDELYPGKNAEVPDPWSGPENGYHVAYAMMEQACEAIVAKHLANNQGSRHKIQIK